MSNALSEGKNNKSSHWESSDGLCERSSEKPVYGVKPQALTCLPKGGWDCGTGPACLGKAGAGKTGQRSDPRPAKPANEVTPDFVGRFRKCPAPRRAVLCTCPLFAHSDR